MTRIPSAAPTSPDLSPPRGGLWRHRDFRLLWIGETTSTLGTSITRVALPLVAVITLHASTLQVSLLTAAAWLPWLAIGLPAGAWVDRFARRPLMLICDALSLLLMLSIPVAAWTGILTLAQLLIVTLLAGTANVFFETAYQVYLPAIVNTDQLTEANAKLQGSAAATQIAGPGLAGLIAQLAGAVTGLIADAISFLISALCLRSIRTQEHRTAEDTHTNLMREIRDGLQYVARDPYLRVMTVFGAASNIALTGYQAILVVFLVRQLGVSPGTSGLVISGMSVGGVIGAAIATPLVRRLGTAHGFLIAELCTAPFGLLIPLTNNGPRLMLTVIGGFVIGTGVASGNVIKGSWRLSYCPRQLLGRITVSMQFLNYGAIPLGALLAGVLGTRLGLRPTLWITQTALIAATLTLLTGPIRHNRDLPQQPLTAQSSQ